MTRLHRAFIAANETVAERTAERDAAVGAVRDLYDIVRELTDSELIDLQEWRDAGGPMAGFADDISKALERADAVLGADR